jgi:UDP-2,3-diacylglucosamine pyrophosphatase LpxH
MPVEQFSRLLTMHGELVELPRIDDEATKVNRDIIQKKKSWQKYGSFCTTLWKLTSRYSSMYLWSSNFLHFVRTKFCTNIMFRCVTFRIMSQIMEELQLG